jgi:hypothetical protein
MGILFGFVGAFIIVITTFGISWRVYNKRQERREAERKAALMERGFGGSTEGMVDVEKGNGKGMQRDIGGSEVRDGVRDRDGFNEERTVGVGAREGEGIGRA